MPSLSLAISSTAPEIAGHSRYSLSYLADGDVLAAARRLVGASNQLLADLLAHLAEVEARGIHRTKACSSLYVYCIYELRLSEDAAFRRVSAARWVKLFPALLDAIASGELNLTGLLMLAPHLTQPNQRELLARARRTAARVGRRSFGRRRVARCHRRGTAQLRERRRALFGRRNAFGRRNVSGRGDLSVGRNVNS